MMNKKRIFVMPLLALFLIAGLFGPPALKASANLPSYRYISIDWVKPPPEEVCRGDTVTVMFLYTVMDFYGDPGSGVVGLPSNLPADSTLLANTMGDTGTVEPQRWLIKYMQPTGRISTVYKANETGGDEITISGNGVLPEGATTSYFQVVNCAYDFSIGGSVYVDDPHTKIDTEFHGKATIQIDDNGLLMGEGTYQYNVSIEYIPPDTIICDRFLKSSNESTFQVTGTASVYTVNYEIKFYPIELKPAVAHCVDRDGKNIERELFPGGTVDVSKEVHRSGTFATSKPQVHFKIPFGTGTMDIWFVKRKPK